MCTKWLGFFFILEPTLIIIQCIFIYFLVVTVERDYGNSNKATIHQDRFLISKSEDNPDKVPSIDYVITFRGEGGS